MKKILITGGAGFVGSSLIKLLVKKKDISLIVSIDNYYSGTIKNHVKSKKVKYIKCDTRKINSNKYLQKINFNIVYHFGEFSRIYPSFEFNDVCWKFNSIGTFEVIKFCLGKKAKLIYSASSAATDDKKNLSPYSWSKYTSNQLIKNYSKWFGLKYVIVYFYNVYGPGQITSGNMTAVIGVFESQYLNNKPLTVVKPGTQKRDLTHIDDIITGTYLASKKINQEFHIRSGENHRIIDVAKMFKTRIKIIQERLGERYESSKENSEKTYSVLKFKPKKSLKEYIKNFIKNNEKKK